MDNQQPEVVRIATEDAEGMTFATRREWKRIHDDQLPELNGYAIVKTVASTTGYYHILQDANPLSFYNNETDPYKLMKYSLDEETGKIIILAMDISEEEAKASISQW